MVQVRRGEVRGFVEGKLLAVWRTDFKELHLDAVHDLKEASLGVSCNDVTVFHVLELTELTGVGRAKR